MKEPEGLTWWPVRERVKVEGVALGPGDFVLTTAAPSKPRGRWCVVRFKDGSRVVRRAGRWGRGASRLRTDDGGWMPLPKGFASAFYEVVLVCRSMAV